MKHRIWLVILPICFLVVFYFYPLLNILILGLLSDGKWGVEKFLQLISKSYYLKTFWFTTWQAFLSTLLALVTALPGAYIFAKYQFPGKRLLRTISTLPFVLPTIVVAAAFQALLGKNGFFNILFSKLFTFDEPVIQINHSICFILIAHVFYNYSVVFRIISGFWCNIKDEMNEAASLLGASPSQVFFKVALPLLKPALLASSILVFILCFSSFGVVLILGGPRYATIEVEIYRQAILNTDCIYLYFNVGLHRNSKKNRDLSDSKRYRHQNKKKYWHGDKINHRRKLRMCVHFYGYTTDCLIAAIHRASRKILTDILLRAI